MRLMNWFHWPWKASGNWPLKNFTTRILKKQTWMEFPCWVWSKTSPMAGHLLQKLRMCGIFPVREKLSKAIEVLSFGPSTSIWTAARLR